MACLVVPHEVGSIRGLRSIAKSVFVCSVESQNVLIVLGRGVVLHDGKAAWKQSRRLISHCLHGDERVTSKDARVDPGCRCRNT
jgi:hypothetical protein